MLPNICLLSCESRLDLVFWLALRILRGGFVDLGFGLVLFPRVFVQVLGKVAVLVWTFLFVFDGCSRVFVWF